MREVLPEFEEHFCLSFGFSVTDDEAQVSVPWRYSSFGALQMHGVNAGLPGQFVEQFVQPGLVDIPVLHGLGRRISGVPRGLLHKIGRVDG
ncbi:hypothetical protein K3U94_08540 [Mycolicibacter heraklionensis]|uniref:Uncharacterized protein n=1 Tax=Mycolicibacter heraklionensis TaxID=512402 RepID=A0A9X7ZJ69_9MYCO|nr:hypothetical protein [Mycolicibacter heraklionensis]QZA09273.1 hypothetical protein K3U94_08540 [Mycolicibacter heraklionensis]